MKKSELFVRILDLVSSKTDIGKEVMLSKTRTEEALDARALAVYFCRKSGFSNKDIKRAFNRIGNRFVKSMCDICAGRKMQSKYYASVFASISAELVHNE